MQPEDEDVREVSDSPSESSDTSVDGVARDAQEKPQDLKDKEDQHSELRKLGMTPSSADLPKLDFSFDDAGALVAKFADKSVKISLPQDVGLRADLPAGDGSKPDGEGAGGEKQAAKPQDKSEEGAGNTVETSSDGTEVRKNSSGQVTEVIDSDGEETNFTRSGDTVTGVTSYDSEGKELR